MKVIGLTGGIGTGKSTVSGYLRKKGIPIIDADQISRQITEKGSDLLNPIRKLLGDRVFFADGQMNRQAVAETIFHDKEKLKKYENLITTEVIRRSLNEIERYKRQQSSPLIVYDAPLLFEFGFQCYTDTTWLVVADLEIRIERISKRDKISKEEIMDRIHHQMPTGEKEALADAIIDNSGDLKRLFQQVDLLLERIENEK